MAKDSPLRDRLEARGAQSAHENLLRQSLLFRTLHLDSASWAREQSFADGDIDFSQGSAATDFYVVIEGAAGVYRDLDGNLDLAIVCRHPGSNRGSGIWVGDGTGGFRDLGQRLEH